MPEIRGVGTVVATQATFELIINTDPLNELDEFALLACQVYNFGNSTDWFGAFRGGLFGLHSRLYGVKTHYRDVHRWIAKPRLQAHWHSNRPLIEAIMEQHDVSKHRETVYSGGMGRKDPPPGFYEQFDARDDPKKQTLLSPHAEINLTYNPKEPRVNRTPKPYEDRVVLETIVENFRTFIEGSWVAALDDARANIHLRYNHFQRT